MDLRHLQTFTAAAEQLSFTKAAKSLGVTQGAASQHIAALEKELGAVLFDRGRGVALTDAGQQLYGYARQILDLVAKAQAEVGDASESVAGALRIATSTVPSESLVPRLLTAFLERCPKVRPEVVVSDSQKAANAVAAGDVDLGFVGELPRSPTLRAEPVAEDELVLVVAAQHALAATGKLKLPELADVPLIIREPGSGSRHCVEAALDEAGLSTSSLTVAMEFNSNDAIRAAVLEQAGAAFLSRDTIADDLQAGRLVEIKIAKLQPRRRLFLISDEQRAAKGPARAFLELVREQGDD
jgi:DNA-binding transcriptional LysR family regulator